VKGPYDIEFAALPSSERREFCLQAAARGRLALPAAAIEKDYWICWILKQIAEIPELRGEITFKGGTSLSKGWGLLDRFSEDLDLAVNRRVLGTHFTSSFEEPLTTSQRKKRLSELQKASLFYVTNEFISLLQSKIETLLSSTEFKLTPLQLGNEVQVEFEYPGTLIEQLGSILPVVRIELIPRAAHLPKEPRRIESFLGGVFPQFLRDESFQIDCLLPEKTFLEKILLIHETLLGRNAGSHRRSRHYYDVYKLYNAGIFERIRTRPHLVKEAINHRSTFYRYTSLDYAQILTSGVRFAPPPDQLISWKSDYQKSKILIFKDLPTFESLMAFSKQFEREFNAWAAHLSG